MTRVLLFHIKAQSQSVCHFCSDPKHKSKVQMVNGILTLGCLQYAFVDTHRPKLNPYRQIKKTQLYEHESWPIFLYRQTH